MSKTRLFRSIQALDVEAVASLLEAHPGHGRSSPQPASLPLQPARRSEDGRPIF
jgi:hypothetical protein